MKIKQTKKGQIALEFVLLSVLSFFILISATFTLTKISNQRTSEQTMIMAQDLGVSIQQEIITASTVENGYIRTYIIPEKINQIPLTIENGRTLLNTSFYVIKIEHVELYYDAPYLIGNITTGNNLIIKQNNTIYIN